MHPRLIRALVGALLGAGLVLAWWGFFRLSPNWPLRLVGDQTCRNDFGCAFGAAIVSLVLTVSLVVGVSMLLGWAILGIFRVRPAWPIAILGPILGWVIWWLADSLLDAVLGETTWRAVITFAIGYGLAGLLSAPRKA